MTLKNERFLLIEVQKEREKKKKQTCPVNEIPFSGIKLKGKRHFAPKHVTVKSRCFV